MALSTHNRCIYIFRQRLLSRSPSDQHEIHERENERALEICLVLVVWGARFERWKQNETHAKTHEDAIRSQHSELGHRSMMGHWTLLFYRCATRQVFVWIPTQAPNIHTERRSPLFIFHSLSRAELFHELFKGKLFFSFFYICFS